MKECELCDVPARMYCESDQASLCFGCDAKVHGANFLVARHSRSLLCQACQSPTPWKASGPRLAPTVSLCERCISRCDGRSQRQGEDEQEEEEEEGEGGNEIEDEDDDDDDDDDDGGDDDDDGDGDDDGDDDDEDGENQVVPWSSTPPPIPSSSSSDESSNRLGGAASDIELMAVSLKRMRENADLGSQDDDLACSSSHHYSDAGAAASAARNSAEDEATSFGASKEKKKAVLLKSARAAELRSALVGSLKRFQKEDEVCGDDDVIGICKMSKDPRAVDSPSRSSPGRLLQPTSIFSD
ncbi:uncharacterized protein LOC131221819 [Magnolia sinica]|uniref:uncharacterized protein LOC131221819 n=1 Tax=Magnolia sinica TaxID=86752 RepID=UPI00265A4A52|nr:uncharacterized protein LOC131221819 [Magnolia sinica]